MPRKNDIRILVVDDEPDVLELVVFHLEKEAYRVDVADTGDRALKSFSKASSVSSSIPDETQLTLWMEPQYSHLLAAATL